MALRTYDAKQVAVVIGGVICQAYADGEFVRVERNQDQFTLIKGADGESTRSKSNDRSGRITLILQQTSETNDLLAAIAVADEVSNNGIVPILVKDNSGNSLHTAAQAWLVKYPNSSYGKESGTKEWVFETDELITFPGGN